jgi:DNA-binding NtrC family response regulator
MAVSEPAMEVPRTGEKEPLLLVDDDLLIVESLEFILHESYEVHAATTRKEAKSLLERLDSIPSLALVDLGLPPTPHIPTEGFTLIGELLARNRRMKILVLSGQSSQANIQHALTLGAVDFVPKPCDPLLLKARLSHQSMMLEAERHETRVTPTEQALLIGTSPAMTTLRALIRQFADTPFPVLVEGESGSGKELVAQCLHSESRRMRAPYLTINCAAFSAELLESQIFGHARGAYTGANTARAGFFEEAGRGSLFLDEIGELPMALQAKLLRVLENGEYYRIGETQPRRSEARIIAATNRDLREAVRSGAFRQDLFHRLSVLTIHVPPLRERGDDTFLLLEHFLERYASPITRFTLDEEAKRVLREYLFPGNVRELRNIVIRLSAKYPGQRVGLRELHNELELVPSPPLTEMEEELDEAAVAALKNPNFCLETTLDNVENRYVRAALRLSGGNLSQAARLLRVNRTTLYSKLQRLSASR